MSATLPLLSVTGLAFLGALRQSQAKPNPSEANNHHAPEAKIQKSSNEASKPNYRALHEAR